jgi:hypothetical protein
VSASGDEPVAPGWAIDRAPGTGHLAIAVETYVEAHRGRWTVDIVVVFADEVVRRRVNDYPTRRHAEIAAAWIKRGAQRDIEGPLNG